MLEHGAAVAMQQKDYSQALEHGGWVAQWLVTAASAGCRGVNSGLSFMAVLHLDCLAPPGAVRLTWVGRESHSVHTVHM